MSVIHITKDNFETYANGDKPLLLDFWATWCGPCRMIAPLVEQISQERNNLDYIRKQQSALESNIRSLNYTLQNAESQAARAAKALAALMVEEGDGNG